MTDMQFGLTLTAFGGGLTLLSLGLIVLAISVLVRFQPRDKKNISSE